MIFQTLILISASFCCCSADWVKVWEDNFDGSSLSDNKWKYETGGEPNWGNNELQYYTAHKANNVRVESGHLVIQAQVENVGGKQFTSGRLDTKEGWTYGKFEINAKLPKGKHLWPALWMMPMDDNYGDWPSSGEIDIMESRGEKSDTVEATVHYGGAFPNNVFQGSPETKFTDLSQNFHNYTLEWDQNEMRWAIDGKQYFKATLNKNLWSGKGKNPYTKAGQPFDKPFYLILNVAVGGDFFPTDEYGKQVTPAEAKNWPKPTMEVDYVKVYEWQ